jgi:hypothetical protein
MNSWAGRRAPTKQFSGVAVPSRGQHEVSYTPHRYDLLGPYRVEELGLVLAGKDNLPVIIPAGLLVYEYIAGVDGGTIDPQGPTVEMRLFPSAASSGQGFGPATIRPLGSNISGYLNLGFSVEGSPVYFEETMNLNITQLQGAEEWTLWLSVIRWAGR